MRRNGERDSVRDRRLIYEGNAWGNNNRLNNDFRFVKSNFVGKLNSLHDLIAEWEIGFCPCRITTGLHSGVLLTEK